MSANTLGIRARLVRLQLLNGNYTAALFRRGMGSDRLDDEAWENLRLEAHVGLGEVQTLAALLPHLNMPEAERAECAGMARLLAAGWGIVAADPARFDQPGTESPATTIKNYAKAVKAEWVVEPSEQVTEPAASDTLRCTVFNEDGVVLNEDGTWSVFGDLHTDEPARILRLDHVLRSITADGSTIAVLSAFDYEVASRWFQKHYPDWIV